MSGNVEEVSKKLRSTSGGNIDVIHWLLGPTDMIVHVHAGNFGELLEVIDDKILAAEIREAQLRCFNRNSDLLQTFASERTPFRIGRATDTNNGMGPR